LAGVWNASSRYSWSIRGLPKDQLYSGEEDAIAAAYHNCSLRSSQTKGT
jgi:hypothetical protein